tara:strand:+ start:110 stop:949 length:840 start_codon:yes stop_codon:yes gene_type:complete
MKTEYYFINNDTRFINIAGDDRQEFLQGLITNDINACDRYNPIYSCILSPQGKFLADFFVIELDGSYLIEIHNRFFDNILQKLQLYKLKSKVIISENNSYLSCVLFINKKITVPNHLISFQDPRNNNIGIRYILNTDNSSSLKKLGFTPVDINYYKEILMKNLIPYSPDDLIVNKSLLLENNFQNINAISWDKGCYVGQEITARMKYRALLKKKIYTLEIISGSIQVGEKITINDISIGEIISITNKFAIAMLKIDAANAVIKKDNVIDLSNAKVKIIH